DRSGNGVANATVEILDLSTKTNSTGYYRLDSVNCGVHRIKISKEGNNTVIAKIFVLPGSHEDFSLTPGNSTMEEDRTEELFALIYACATIQIIFLVFILAGGVFAIKRKHFGVCVVGSVVGILSMFVVIGAILSITALILIALSKDEFEKRV
ncbi:MAG: carboxypeptidase-like regulatory domain-containing protein, partial [Candidatus Thermoplasmatota archaeon]